MPEQSPYWWPSPGMTDGTPHKCRAMVELPRAKVEEGEYQPPPERRRCSKDAVAEAEIKHPKTGEKERVGFCPVHAKLAAGWDH